MVKLLVADFTNLVGPDSVFSSVAVDAVNAANDLIACQAKPQLLKNKILDLRTNSLSQRILHLTTYVRYLT